MAVAPDLTAGGVPNEDPAVTINLGPTGARGWVYHVKSDTSESRQILIKNVDSTLGSPARNILTVNDIILGADGTGADPVNFSSDARKSFALAIADAEARTPANLKLLRWRNGTTTTETLTLQTMGTYSTTAPYNCPKSTKILNDGLQYVYNNEDSGRYSFGAITLLANGNPTYMAKAKTEAEALIPDQATMNQMMSDDRDATAMVTWQRGHTLIFLAEYYLASDVKDPEILAAVRAYAVNIAKNTSLFGTVGHIFAEKNDDGTPNGPMGGVYGVVNTPGLFCFLGVLLAKECGVTDDVIDPAIERANRFFAYYSGKGSIPYGEHEPFFQNHENQGKCALTALAFMLQDDRVTEQKFFAKMSTASPDERELGHTGPFFNYMWAPLGAAVGGEEAAAAHFSRISWMLDLNRRWDGGFDYDCLNGEGPNSGAEYNDFRMSTAVLLTYALPLRQMYITGKAYDTDRWLTTDDVTEAVAANDYEASSRTDSELIDDLGNWSPKVVREAGIELGLRTIDEDELQQITDLANDTNGPSRPGACYALGQIGDASSADTLAALITDSDCFVRYMATEAMRYLPQDAKETHLDTILTAADTTSQPLYPLIDEDPLHFAHGRIAMLLFYSWNSFGPKGVIHSSGVNGVDRKLLYPAIRAIAKTPIGLSRGTLEHTYEYLTYDDVLEVSGSIVDAVVNRAPADKMFSDGARRGGVAVLQKHGISEGVPACMAYAADEVGGKRNTPLSLLGTFGGSVYSVTPDPDAVAFLQSYLTDDETADTAQASIDQIAADENPITLMPLKSIQSITADDTSITLPNNSTSLRLTANDYAKGDSIYTWSKLSGPGGANFTPNGTADANDITVQFDGSPGVYQFQVTMSDSRGLTEAYETITVRLIGGDGVPPTPNPPTFSSAPSADSSSAVSMTATIGSDVDGPVQYYFEEISGNPGGSDSGWQTSPSYTDSGLNASTPYIYTVTMRDSSNNTGTASEPANVTTLDEIIAVLESEDFEAGMGNWINVDTYQWYRDSEGTPSNRTGPDSGANGSTWYMFMETSGGYASTAGNTAILEASVIDAINRELRFYYHMYGSNMGTLNVDIFDNKWNLGVWSISGQQHSSNSAAYTQAVVDLSNFTGPIKIRFRGVAAGSWQGDMAVDDIEVIDKTFQDTTPPTPNSATFSSAPSADSSSAISMTATVGSDASNPIQYYFDEISGNPGGSDSGWQTSPSYTDSGLNPSTQYTYTVTMRDSAATPNIGTASAGKTAMTDVEPDIDPPTPNPMTWAVAPAPDRGVGSGDSLIIGQMQWNPGTGVQTPSPFTAVANDLLQTSLSEMTRDSGAEFHPEDFTNGITDVGTAYDRPDGHGENGLEIHFDISGKPQGYDIYEIRVFTAGVDDPAGFAQVSQSFNISYQLVANAGSHDNATFISLGDVLAEPAGASTTGGILMTRTYDDTFAAIMTGISAIKLHTKEETASSGAVMHFTQEWIQEIDILAVPSGGGLSETQISMTATTAADPSGIEYYFACTAGNGNDSGWQDSPSYTDTNLSPCTQYTYTVTARDKSSNNNATTPSTAISAITNCPPPADIDGDGDVDETDMAMMADDWLKSSLTADIYPQSGGDGIVNLEDFTLFVQYWLYGI